MPKVACSTVKKALHHLEGVPYADNPHDLGWELSLAAYTDAEIVEFLTAPDWLRLCFVRNPYDRMFSAWKSKIGNYWDQQYAPLRQRIRDHYEYPQPTGTPPPLVAFRDFVDYVVTDVDDDYRLDAHWDRQVNILMPDLIQYDVIGRFETFVADFTQVLGRIGAPPEVVELARQVTNPTPHVPLSAAYDAGLADRVFAHYREDFDTFGYDGDSWRYHDGNQFVR